MLLWLFCWTFVATFILILSYRDIAKKFGIVDKPDERRNHIGELVRGAGIVILFCSIISYYIYISYYNGNATSTTAMKILLISAVLGIIFFLEDVGSVRTSIRFTAQIVSAILAVYICKDMILVLPNVPYFVNFIIVVIGWVWFMNLYNFMDGIDGMTATNTIFFLLAIILLTSSSMFGAKTDIDGLCISILPTFIAFFLLNRHPAKVIIGDSGSIAFGFILGYIFLNLSNCVGLVIPIIICSYYLFDSSLTLISRITKMENILNPHSKHFFQIAVRGGLKPNQICNIIICVNIAMFGIAYLLLTHNSTINVLIGIISCLIINAILLTHFYSYKK